MPPKNTPPGTYIWMPVQFSQASGLKGYDSCSDGCCDWKRPRVNDTKSAATSRYILKRMVLGEISERCVAGELAITTSHVVVINSPIRDIRIRGRN